MITRRAAEKKAGHAEIVEFLRDAPPRALDMLRVMREQGANPSFAAVAATMSLDKRVVSGALRRLNSQYGALTNGGALLTRGENQRHYELTEAGERVADELVLAQQRLITVLKTSSGKHKELWLPVTNDCIKHVPRISSLLGGDLVLRPSPRRSAELQPLIGTERSRERDYRSEAYAFYSACLDVSTFDDQRVLNIKAYDGPAEVVVVDRQPFAVLASTSLFPHDKMISLQDLWDLDGGLIVPEGGAVCDLLDYLEPGWEQRRPYLRSTDLDFSLSCLTTPGLITSPAMLVHAKDRFDSLMPDYRLFELADTAHLEAVTGLFRRSTQAMNEPATRRQLWQRVWDAAVATWAPPTIEGRAS